MALHKVIGLENEYGFAAFRTENGSVHPRTECTTELVDRLLRIVHQLDGSWRAQPGASRLHLRNGGVVYRDTGDHPEYATPECADALQVLRADRAGERVFAAALVLLDRDAANTGTATTNTCNIYKHNGDFGGNTFGTHENYSVSADLSHAHYAQQLGSFLATRSLIAGSGGVVLSNTKLGFGFVLSPRALHITNEINARSTLDRPIYNVRDEPHADHRRFRRVHLLCGDANRCDVSTLLKVGTTAIVLAMIEDHALPQDLALLDPISALHSISTRPSAPVTLADGRTMTALELQRAFCTAAHRYAETAGLDACGGAVGDAVLTQWSSVLDTLERNAWRELFGVIDWPTKRVIVERRAHLLRDAGATPREIRLAIQGEELAYANIVPGRSTYEALRSRGRITCWTSNDPEIEPSLPTGTRAELRSTLVARWPHAIRQIDWSKVTFDIAGADVVFDLRDPMLSDPECINRIRALPMGTSVLAGLARAMPRSLIQIAGGQRNAVSLSVILDFCAKASAVSGTTDLQEASYEVGRAAVTELANQVFDHHSTVFRSFLSIAMRGFELAGCPEQLPVTIRAMRDGADRQRHQLLAVAATNGYIPESTVTAASARDLDRVVLILTQALDAVDYPAQHPQSGSTSVER